MKALRLLLLLASVLPPLAWSVQQYDVKVIDQRAQPRDHFVQGLEIQGDYLYVSVGNYGESRLLRYRFPDGGVDAVKHLDEQLFAEGLTVLDHNIYQLTWRNRAMLVYRESDLEFQRWLPLPGEGWGLTNNGRELIYSDGSARLHIMSADTGRILRSITVTEQGRPVELLNELEWVDGSIWANIWYSDRIVVIDPDSGRVTASINLRGLLPADEYQSGTDVLNGIARNPADGAVWVTGKRWPWLYRIELLPVTAVPESQQSGAVSR
ncbi:MAG: glutaminyl-peptide cyclotransferase [Halioglobus sp.]|nr:glutaminyl-peptide cyclotransferase [Halioglobus sp.]